MLEKLCCYDGVMTLPIRIGNVVQTADLMTIKIRSYDTRKRMTQIPLTGINLWLT